MSTAPEDETREPAPARTTTKSTDTTSTETDMRGEADTDATVRPDRTGSPQPTTPADPPDPTDRTLLPTAGGAECLAALRTVLGVHRLPAVAAALVLVAGTGIGLLTAPLLGHIVDLVVEREG
ncbi:hypothetical protein ACWGDD_35435, partial [Streptomyces sp. NPDC055011]